MKLIKYHNVFFPIWLIILFPPLVFLTLLINFIVDSLVILFTLKYLKITNYKHLWKKTILKTWVLGFIADIIGVFILLLISFIDILSVDIISAIFINPFSNIFGFFLVSFAILTVSYLIYLFNFHFVFNSTNLTKKDNHTLSLSLAIFTAPYLFLLPTILFI